MATAAAVLVCFLLVWLPFQYMARAIRETIDVPATGVSLLPFVVPTLAVVSTVAYATVRSLV